ncbi:MAG: hypothetical protein DRP35_02645 [Candidatus Zixiibacteriota bacterium]|nr:MAG: hypothetical protein DRP35_02645 [candidate division Zixibacteria bacterium]
MVQRKNYKALLYLRVSSKEQEKEGYSLDAQEKLGKEYAIKNNLEIVRIWKGSESAWKKERTFFNQMVDFCKKHRDVKHIIFDITDRMTRNDFDKLKINTLIKDFDKTIHFSRTNKIIDKNSGSDVEFMFDIEVAVAKKMSNDISRKAKMGMLEKAEQGEYPSTAPIGYFNNKETQLVEIDLDRAPFIKMAFENMSTGNYSLSTLVEKIYSDGLRTKKNFKVTKSTLAHLLKNPFYYGCFFWKGKLYNGIHNPIISKQMYDNVQRILSGKGHSFKTNKNGFVFNNLIKCGECGCKVLGERKKEKYIYYHCTFSKGRHNGGNAYLKEDRLAVLFEDSVRKVTISSEKVKWAKNILKVSKYQQNKLIDQELSLLIRNKSKIEKRINSLYDLRIDGDIDKEVFNLKEIEYKSQLSGLDLKIEQSQKVNLNYYEDGCKILELSNRLFPLYLRSDPEEKARILRLIASNYLLEGATISASYNKPFIFMEKLGGCPTKLPR